MKLRTLALLLSSSVLLSGCASLTHFQDANAEGFTHIEREECVPYARRVSDIELHGDAWTWWQQAQGVYMRGHIPAPGAVLVLARTTHLPHGHLAVVTDYISPREIKVTHTNWGNSWLDRRVTYEQLRAEDVSTANDWTKVRFWNYDEGAFGFPYQAYGFIYNHRPICYGAQNCMPEDSPPPMPPQQPVMMTPQPAPMMPPQATVQYMAPQSYAPPPGAQYYPPTAPMR